GEMKKLICFFVVLSFVSIGAISGAKETMATQKSTKVINLKFSDWGSPTMEYAQRHIKWMKMIEERSGGRVKITPYWSASLLSIPETYRGIASGLADCGMYVTGLNPGIQALNLYVSLPFLGYPSGRAAMEVYKAIWKKFPEIDAEFTKTGTKVVAVSFMEPNQLHLTVNKVVKKPEDLKGMRIMCSSDYAKVFPSVGASNVRLGPPDWYSSLDRGLVQGHIVHYPAMYLFKTWELFKTHTEFGPGGSEQSAIMVLFSLKTWNSLPPDIQKIIRDVSAWWEEDFTATRAAEIEKARALCVAAGHTITALTPEEIQVWIDWAKPIHEHWIETTEAKGLPARAVLEEAKRLIDAYGK
ncbi:MAG: TRAP transporter substrate-binding protein DctP, partial [Planctomycetota bacterium]